MSLLTAAFPILPRGRSPAEDFLAGEMAFISAAERVLVDATAIDVTRELFKNRRRVSLFDILVSLQQTLPDFKPIYRHQP